MKVAQALILCVMVLVLNTLHSATAGVVAEFLDPPNNTLFIPEGPNQLLSYDYIVRTTAGERFVAPPLFGRNGEVVITDNASNTLLALQTFNLQDNVMQSGGGGSRRLDFNDNGQLRLVVRGSVALERGFNTQLGTFNFFDSVNIVIFNVAPTLVDVPTDTTVGFNEIFFLNATATDPAVNDIVNIQWDLFSDGTIDFIGPSYGILSGNIAQTVPVTVTAIDDDGGVSTPHNFSIIVIPEPTSLAMSSLLAGACFYTRKTRRILS